MSTEQTNPELLIRNLEAQGSVRGARSAGGIVFRDIPYAAPPVGARRFASPAPPAAWGGIRDTEHRGPIAPQPPSRVEAVMGPIEGEQGEDCLSLTIWAPEQAAEPLPVMVWLHGGGFATGAASLPWYDGGALATGQNVVVVGVNYRLGALAFLSVAGQLPGNLFLLDQIAALQWVQANIEVFGGDPGRVTVMGESGGAHNIASLLTIDASDGLFHRAILQSAPLGIGLATPEVAHERSDAFLTALHVNRANPALLDTLREASVDAILAAQQDAGVALMRKTLIGDVRPFFLPHDGPPHGLGGKPFIAAVAQGAAERGVDVMVGWTRDEANLYMRMRPQIAGLTEEEAAALASQLWGDNPPPTVDPARPDEGNAASPGERLMAAVTDHNFRMPAEDLAGQIARLGGRAFTYRFDWASPDPILGACHGLELPFVFGTAPAWREGCMIEGADMSKVAALSAIMMRSWADFARDGNPGFGSWSGDRRPLMHFDNESWVEESPATDSEAPAS